MSNNKDTIKLGEIFYYLFLLCVMGGKAIGMSEGQRPFTALLVLGLLFVVLKMAVTEYMVYECVMNILLIGLGIVVLLNNGHKEVLFAVLMVIGMKNVPVKRAMKVAACIWTPCFIMSIIRALLGFYDGYVGTQMKAGMSSAVIRYSLGYTHPNVLHMTYLVIVLMVLYLLGNTNTMQTGADISRADDEIRLRDNHSAFNRKKLVILSIFLMIGNLYIFLYSVSYTGVLVVTLCILINLYLSFRSNISLVEKVIAFVGVAASIFVMLVGNLVLPESVKDLINSVINLRLQLTGEMLSVYRPALFGTDISAHVGSFNLDCSFAYMLVIHGIIGFSLFVIAYLAELVHLLRTNDKKGIVVLFSAALSGITEQYLGNFSFKNITYFFIGDYVYNVLAEMVVNSRSAGNSEEIVDFHENKSALCRKFSLLHPSKSEFSLRGYRRRVASFKRFFEGTNWIKCILPGVIVAIVIYVIVAANYEGPKTLYEVHESVSEAESKGIGADSLFEYNESEDYGNAIIIGNPTAGAYLYEISWVNLTVELWRVRISAALWGFIIGFLLMLFGTNLRKINKVYIEDPIITDDIYKNGNVASSILDLKSRVTTCSILGVNIAVTNMRRTVAFLSENINALRDQYICVSNVHTTETAFKDESYRDVQNGAFMALPDGKPLSYVERSRGYFQADRVAGPDLMTEIFKISAEKGYRHFFYGSTPETLAQLKANLENMYPGIDIVGMLSPDYYKTVDDIPAEVDEEHIRTINDASPDFLWVGLGAPKQEIWMAKHKNKVNALMLGVGAGFDFHAGTIKRAPAVMQALYLEWLYRLLQDPKRLFKRYLNTNLAFIRDAWKENKKIKKRKDEIAYCDRAVNQSNLQVATSKQSSVTRKPRLLFYAHYYAPDVASTGQILTELAEGLKDDFDVTVVAVVPSYDGNVSEHYSRYRYYLQEMNGVKVYRVRVPEFTKTNKVSRVVNLYHYYRNARAITRKINRQDYIFTISQPPILGGRLGVYGKKKMGAKLIYNIQDFNPEQIISTGYVKGEAILNILKKIDIDTCNRADLLVTVGRDLVDTLHNRTEWKHEPDCVMINNWIDEEKIYPLSSDDENVTAFKQRYGLEDKFVFMYSGNIGLYYDLDSIIKTIEQVKPGTCAADGREIVFAFVGGGSKREALEEYVSNHHMTNVIFIPYQDKAMLNYSLNAADVHICSNAMGIKGVSCPSKYYGIAAAGKPVLAVLEEGSEIRCLIEGASSGLVSEPMDSVALFENINIFAQMPRDELKKMGQRTRDFVVSNMTKRMSIEKYKDEILNL